MFNSLWSIIDNTNTTPNNATVANIRISLKEKCNNVLQSNIGPLEKCRPHWKSSVDINLRQSYLLFKDQTARRSTKESQKRDWFYLHLIDPIVQTFSCWQKCCLSESPKKNKNSAPALVSLLQSFCGLQAFTKCQEVATTDPLSFSSKHKQGIFATRHSGFFFALKSQMHNQKTLPRSSAKV